MPGAIFENQIQRRGFLQAAVALGASVTMTRQAVAAPPFELTHGDFQIKIFSDGHMVVPAAFLAQNAPADQLDEILARSAAPAPDIWPKANVPLIQHGNDLILFDVGDGKKFQKTEGELITGLTAAGIDPSSITKVVLTHAHPDHIWGLSNAFGALNFPNAEYFAGVNEWEFWTAPDVALRLPDAFRAVVPETQRNLKAIAGNLRLLKAGDDVVQGMRAFSTPGHTPGHLSFELDGGGGLIVTADAITHEMISVEHPGWRNGFDYDSDVAISTRNRLIDRLSKDKTRLLSFHFPYPGTGFLEQAGTSHRFVAG